MSGYSIEQLTPEGWQRAAWTATVDRAIDTLRWYRSTGQFNTLRIVPL